MIRSNITLWTLWEFFYLLLLLQNDITASWFLNCLVILLWIERWCKNGDKTWTNSPHVFSSHHSINLSSFRPKIHSEIAKFELIMRVAITLTHRRTASHLPWWESRRLAQLSFYHKEIFFAISPVELGIVLRNVKFVSSSSSTNSQCSIKPLVMFSVVRIQWNIWYVPSTICIRNTFMAMSIICREVTLSRSLLRISDMHIM